MFSWLEHAADKVFLATDRVPNVNEPLLPLPPLPRRIVIQHLSLHPMMNPGSRVQMVPGDRELPLEASLIKSPSKPTKLRDGNCRHWTSSERKEQPPKRRRYGYPEPITILGENLLTIDRIRTRTGSPTKPAHQSSLNSRRNQVLIHLLPRSRRQPGHPPENQDVHRLVEVA